MAFGRKTGGRQKGTPNKAISKVKLTAQLRAAVSAGGELPLDYMMRIMRDANADRARRDDMAKAAAPYVHSRLASVEHTVTEKRDVSDWTRDELVAIVHDAGKGSAGAASANGRDVEPDKLH